MRGRHRFDVIYGTVTGGNTSATAGVQRDDACFTQYFCNGDGGPPTGGWTMGPTGTPTPNANSYSYCYMRLRRATATATATATPTATATQRDSDGYCNTDVNTYTHAYSTAYADTTDRPITTNSSDSAAETLSGSSRTG